MGKSSFVAWKLWLYKWFDFWYAQFHLGESKVMIDIFSIIRIIQWHDWISGMYLFPRYHSRHGLSQWETTLQCDGISHWLCPYPERSYNESHSNEFFMWQGNIQHFTEHWNFDQLRINYRFLFSGQPPICGNGVYIIHDDYNGHGIYNGEITWFDADWIHTVLKGFLCHPEWVLTHWGRVTHSCVIKLSHHWFR